MKGGYRVRLRVLPLLGGLLLALTVAVAAAPIPASAHANLTRAEPAAGSAAPTAPAEVRLWFTEATEPRYSEVAIYDAGRKRYDQGAARHLPGEGASLVVAAQDLPEGIYTVAWKALSAVDGHTTTGSFAFAVGNTPPPADAGVGITQFTPPTPAEVVTRWLALLAATAFTGALGLRVLVWEPALRRAGVSGPPRAKSARGRVPGPRESASTGTTALEGLVHRRLTLLTGVALVLVFLATVVGLILQAAKVAGVAVVGALDAPLLGDFLFNTRTGGIWSVRLLLPLVAAMTLGPPFVAALRGVGAAPDPGHPPPAEPPAQIGIRRVSAPAAGSPLAPAQDQPALLLRTSFGLALGAAYLLTISLISHGAASPLWTPFTIAMDWIHLLATAVWVGGLLGLVLTVPALRALPGGARVLLSAVVSRFSNIALLSVGALAVTGTYSAWLHVGSLDALRPTDYGRVLTVKLALFAGLVALGAANFLWVRPRLAATDPGNSVAAERVGAVLLRHFGRAIRLEAVLGVAILLAAALLTGFVPAREAIVQARAPKLAQTLKAGDLQITLALASLQPGDNRFDVLVKEARSGKPVTDAQRVALRLNMTDMDMGEAEAIAEPSGAGHYLASGPYLAMSGNWQTRVIVRRAGVEDVDATFALAIGSAANLATTPNAPTPPDLTSARVIGLVSLAGAVLLAAFGVPLFRRGSGFGTLLLMLVPTAVVVGGYLLYTDTGPVLRRPPDPPNPIATDAASVAQGRALFATNCVVCHGPQARGDGPAAATLNPRPPDMSLPHTVLHSDGYLFNAITNGVPGSAMPVWGDRLNERERWDLVNYLRTLNPLTGGNPDAAPRQDASPQAAGPTSPARAIPTVTPAGGPSAAGTATAGAPSPVAPGSASSGPADTRTGAGRLIYAFDGKLWALDPTGGTAVNLTPGLPPNSYVADPALSPDGATLAYTLIAVPPVAGLGTPSSPALPGTDLYLMGASGMDASGGGGRLLLRHDRPGVVITRPVWTADGQALVYGYSAPLIGPNGWYTGAIRELRRLDLASGEQATLVPEADNPALSPAALAYILTDTKTFDQSLWLARADGQDGRRLIGPDAGFDALGAPQFSPDGRRLVFAAVGGPGVTPSGARAPTPRGGPLGRVARWFVAPFTPPPAAAHGPPWDLWTVALDGGDLRRLTEVYEDQPSPAWSPDGERVAFLAGGGLYIIGADGRGLTKVSARGSHGSLVWAPTNRSGGAPAPAPSTPVPTGTAVPRTTSTDDGRSQRRALDDLVVALQIEPRVFQPTDVEVRLSGRDGEPVAGIARVDLQFAMVGMDHGARGIVAAPTGDGRYRARGMLLAMEGPWLLALRVEGADGRVRSGVFAFRVAPDTATGAIAALHTRPPGPIQIEDIAVYPNAPTPGQIEVVAGRAVRLEIIYVDRPACGSAVRLDELDLGAEVTAEGLTELSFIPRRSGPLRLACTPSGLVLSPATAGDRDR